MAIFRDAGGTTRFQGDLLAPGGATGDVLTQQADGTFAPASVGLPDWFMSGSGSPVDVTTPEQTGSLYVDTDNGALYLAMGPADTDWIVLGFVPGNIGEATGLALSAADRDLYIMAGERDDHDGFLYIGHTFNQWNGHQQGIGWSNGAAEGGEQFRVLVGSTGQYALELEGSGGLFTVPGGIKAANLPTNDPGPGFLWNDGGIITMGT